MAVVTSLHECRGINNRLLLAMSPATLDRILRISDPVSLVRGQEIVTTGQPIKYIHFINRGLVCATKTMEDGRMVEIAAIGVEGTAEFVALLGMDRALVDMVVRIPGTAIRIARNAFMHEMENDEPLRQLMQRYVRFGLSEVARHIACNRLHHLDQRCCRWLLIAHDHALSDEFPLTHEDLALMLGYQRAGVSIAMASLVKAGFIEHKRGKVIVSDRPGLEAAACECYGEMQNELDEFLPRPKKRHKCSNSHRTKSPSAASVTLNAGAAHGCAVFGRWGPAALAPGRGHCSKPNRAKTRKPILEAEGAFK